MGRVAIEKPVAEHPWRRFGVGAAGNTGARRNQRNQTIRQRSLMVFAVPGGGGRVNKVGREVPQPPPGLSKGRALGVEGFRFR